MLFARCVSNPLGPARAGHAVTVFAEDTPQGYRDRQESRDGGQALSCLLLRCFFVFGTGKTLKKSR